MINIQMASNIPELKDQFLIQYILGELVNKVLKCEMVEQDSIEEMEDYPFVTFNWINFDNPTTVDWLGEHKQYICTMQVDVHANKSYQAASLAQTLYNALHEDVYRRFFKQANILPINITNTSNRTALSGINYDNDFGFDCSFSIIGGYVYQSSDLNFDVVDSAIESVRAKPNIIGSKINDDINVSKDDKEETI